MLISQVTRKRIAFAMLLLPLFFFTVSTTAYAGKQSKQDRKDNKAMDKMERQQDRQDRKDNRAMDKMERKQDKADNKAMDAMGLPK